MTMYSRLVKLPAVFFIVLFASCGGQSRNDAMTGLINAKKATEDSIKYYRSSESLYHQKVMDIAHATHDSTQYRPVLDTEFMYSNNAFRCESKLKDLQFSIDSLSKMK